jgi:hypothetical protein
MSMFRKTGHSLALPAHNAVLMFSKMANLTARRGTIVMAGQKVIMEEGM